MIAVTLLHAAFAADTCVVPEHDRWTLEEETPPDVSASPGRMAVMLYNDPPLVALLDAAAKPTLSVIPLTREPPVLEARVLDLGPAWGQRLRCRETPTGDMVDCLTGELILAGDRGDPVPDIDGDGLVDLHGWNAVYLQRDEGWLTVPYPQVSLLPYEYFRFLPLGDVTGDGLGDVLLAVDTGLDPNFGLPNLTNGVLHLFPGTPDGYSDTPLWVVHTDTPVAHAFGLQMDDDPELEVFALGADDWGTGPPDSVSFIYVDPTPDGADVEHLHELEDNNTYGGNAPLALAFDDVDGDGLGDVAFFSGGAVCEANVMGRVVVSSRRWDPEQPWFIAPALRAPDATRGDEFDYLGTNQGAVVVDFDGDGHLDIGTVYRETRPEDLTYIQIWYPMREPQPPHTGDTGLAPDTASSTAADTGTADTATGTRATDATPSPTQAETPSRCGCHPGLATSGLASSALLPLLLVRRRAQRRAARSSAP